MNTREYKELKKLIEQSAEFAAEQLISIKTDLKIEIKDSANKLKTDIKTEIDNARNDILSTVDAYAKRADGQWQENKMLTRKVDRHEKWIDKIAKDADVKLDY